MQIRMTNAPGQDTYGFCPQDDLEKSSKGSVERALKRNALFRDIVMKVAQEDSDDVDTDDIPDDNTDEVDEIIGEDYRRPTVGTELEDFGTDEN